MPMSPADLQRLMNKRVPRKRPAAKQPVEIPDSDDDDDEVHSVKPILSRPQ